MAILDTERQRIYSWLGWGGFSSTQVGLGKQTEPKLTAESKGIHLLVDPPSRLSEGKLLQRTRAKVAPQTPERRLRVGVICERRWPGARPQGRHPMAKPCPQIQPEMATKLCRVCPVDVRSRSSNRPEPANTLRLTPLFSESLAAVCGTAITQNTAYQCTTVGKAFDRMTVLVACRSFIINTNRFTNTLKI